MKKVLVLIMVLSVTLSAFSGGKNKTGIGDLKFNDKREVVDKKLDSKYCDVTSDQSNSGINYIITAKKYAFRYKGLHRIEGTVTVSYVQNKYNGLYHMTDISFIVTDKNKKLNKYVDFLNDKYFPNIDSDKTWWDKYKVIVKNNKEFIISQQK